MQDDNQTAPAVEDEIIEVIALEDDSDIEFEALAACQGPNIGK